MLRLPRPSIAAETRLIVTACADGELWERTFDGHRFVTRQYESGSGWLSERFGVLEFHYRLDESGGGLLYTQRDAVVRCGRVSVPIPASLAPRVEAREDPAGPTAVKVHVHVALPLVGPLLTYDGVIEVEDPPA